MDKALNELERISNDKEIIGLYDVEAVERKVYNSKMKTAERIGMENGKREEKNNLALKMLKNNVNIDDIVLYTDLKVEEINKLKESLK